MKESRCNLDVIFAGHCANPQGCDNMFVHVEGWDNCKREGIRPSGAATSAIAMVSDKAFLLHRARIWDSAL